MSAQVFNPMAISEFRRLVSHPNNNNNSSIDRIRRNLFGPVDRDESRALAERELAKIRRIDMENWSFDFAKEEPVNGPDSKFVWERLTPQDVHESYALRRFEYLGMAATTTNKTTVSSMPASDAVSTSERTKSQQQKQITDYFLAARRRPSSLSLSSNSKKLSKSSKPILRSLRLSSQVMSSKKSSRVTSSPASAIRRS
ncbi:cyclin-dependent kinase inhibitor 1B [Nilaparvata lugens]|uniref:cyclin-dependent kinase inhibitor 1B n=1 Tax=Nilaparvata lugens TaxID=108931 RepID=UPI000B97EB79|nr:cyclin-dependent kinase inhibitor 1B [Nilaparvata lugens]